MQLKNPLDSELLSANDVLLVPRHGILPSRSLAKLKPFIFSAPMDTVTGYTLSKAMYNNGEYPVVSRSLQNPNEYKKCLEDFHSIPGVFFAIGAGKKSIQKLIEELEAINHSNQLNEQLKLSVAIDVAHGDSVFAHETAAILKSLPFIGNIMSGSICTPDAAHRAVQAGCTHLRVGVGPGAACTTRLMTGCGFPQLSAIYLINKAIPDTDRDRLTIIADGGIKHPGDAVKYLAAGADAIMMGATFSRAKESTGWTKQNIPLTIDKNTIIDFTIPRQAPEPILVKSYRGQASAAFQQDFKGGRSQCPEGAATAQFEWDQKTTCQSIVKEYRGGIASALSYLGLTSMDELKPENVSFIKITTATYMEGTPHGT